MSDEDQEKASWSKGDRAAIVSGRKNVGARGEIFWIGENKWGPGLRYGLRGDDGETYWVDENSIGPEADAPPAPDKPKSDEGEADLPVLAKGARVEIVGGRSGKGEKGEIFWVGENKYGKGMRYGVRADDGETHWVDGNFARAIDEPAPAKQEAASGSADASEFADFADEPLAQGGAMPDDVPMPDASEFDDRVDGAPEEDAPFGDDIPF